jgi:hypothetical protein
MAVLAAAVWYVRPEAGLWPLGLILVGWLLRLAFCGRLTRITPLDAPLALFLGTALLAASIGYNQGSEWALESAPQMWAWGKFYYILGAVGLYYAIANLREVDHVWWLTRCLALFGTGVAAYFLLTNDWGAGPTKLDALTQAATWLDRLLPELPGRRLHPNVVGGLIAMMLPYFVPLLLDSRKRKARRETALWIAAVAMALFGLLMSVSRGAWLAVAATGALWFFLRAASARGRLALLASMALLLAVLAVLLTGTTALQALTDSPIVAGVPGVSTAVSRLELLKGSWALAQDYLLTGGGLGSFPMLFSTYYLLVPVYFILHSHNLFLDILIEQGILGLSSYLWLLATFALLAVRSVGHASRRRTAIPSLAPQDVGGVRWRLVIEASLASAAVAVLHGLMDDVAYGSRALLLIFVPFAVVVALQGHLHEPTWRLPYLLITVAAGVALAAGLILWQREAWASVWFANQGALAQARVELTGYRFPERFPELVRREADLSDATRSFEQAIQRDAAQRTANQRLAGIALARGNYEAALGYAQTAYSRDATNVVTWQLLGDAYLALGRLDEAYTLWSQVADAETRLQNEAWLRYESRGDNERAGWARMVADRVRTGRQQGR